MLKTVNVQIGAEEWGMDILCDTPNQGLSIAEALKFYYENHEEPLEYLEVYQNKILIEKII